MAEVQLDTRLPLAVQQFPGIPVEAQLQALARIRSGRARERLQGVLEQKAFQEIAQQQQAAAQQQRGVEALQNPQAFLAAQRNQGLDRLARARDVTPGAPGDPQALPELAAGTIRPEALDPSLQPQEAGPRPPDPTGVQGPPVAQRPQTRPRTREEALLDPEFPIQLMGAGLFEVAKKVAGIQLARAVQRGTDLANDQESLAFASQLIAPIAASNVSLAEKDRQYQRIKGRFAQELDALGIPKERVMSTWNQAEAELLIAQGKDSAQSLAEATQANRVEQDRLKNIQEQLELPTRLKSLSTAVKGALSGEGLLTPGNFANDEQVAAAVQQVEVNKLAVAGERSKQEALNRLLPATITTPLQEIDQLQFLLGEVQRDFKDEYVGFFTGPGRRLKAKTGKLTEQEIRWRQNMDLASEIWSRARSGAVINATEGVKFDRQIPVQGDPPNVFRGKMRGMSAFMGNHRKNLIRAGTTTVGEARQGALSQGGQTVDLQALQVPGTATAGFLPLTPADEAELRRQGATPGEIETIKQQRRGQ